jgi:hypothetical protein
MNKTNHLLFSVGFLFTLCATPKDIHAAGNIYLSNYENSALGVSKGLNDEQK